MSNIKKFIVSSSLLGAMVLFSACSDVAAKSGEGFSGAELAAMQDDNKKKENYLVIDVRSKEEYEAGHVKHAINIPLEEFGSKLASLDGFKNKDIVLYCNTGNRSSKAQKILQDNGFTKTHNAEGVKQYNYNLVTYGNVLGVDLAKANVDQSAIIVDVREAKDFEKGHLKGAINIPDGTPIDEVVAKLQQYKDKTIITHCYTGNRSAKLANELSKRGFSDVRNSLDGTKEYNYSLVK